MGLRVAFCMTEGSSWATKFTPFIPRDTGKLFRLDPGTHLKQVQKLKLGGCLRLQLLQGSEQEHDVDIQDRHDCRDGSNPSHSRTLNIHNFQNFLSKSLVIKRSHTRNHTYREGKDVTPGQKCHNHREAKDKKCPKHSPPATLDKVPTVAQPFCDSFVFQNNRAESESQPYPPVRGTAFETARLRLLPSRGACRFRC
jgi:hypothetical protein